MPDSLVCLCQLLRYQVAILEVALSCLSSVFQELRQSQIPHRLLAILWFKRRHKLELFSPVTSAACSGLLNRARSKVTD